jgi:hypothetical protein
MGSGPYRHNQHQPVQPPNVFFDGTRLGLEGSMTATLIICGLGGLHIGLSAQLGYLSRYAEGLPEVAKPFSLFGFVFTSLLAMIALAMVLFFASAIPTMLYSMGLVYGMLRWVGKRRPKTKLWSTVFGSLLGLLVGFGIAFLGGLLFDLGFSPASYVRLLSWPAILTIDGVALVWITLYPPISAIAGGQIGWRLGKQLEELSLYYFW